MLPSSCLYVPMPKRGPTLKFAADLMALWSAAELVPPPAPGSAVISGTTPTLAPWGAPRRGRGGGRAICADVRASGHAGVH